MLIREAFDYRKCGMDINKKQATRPDDLMNVKKIQKSAMQSSKFLESRLIDVSLPYTLEDKYFLHEKDIVISLKDPYCAAALSYLPKNKILIPNNYVVLRDINTKKYNYLFVVNYLNLIGIKKILKRNKDEDIHTDLTLADVEDISLPNISLAKQESILKLCDAINERNIIYETIKDNDRIIIEKAMKELVGDKDV